MSIRQLEINNTMYSTGIPLEYIQSDTSIEIQGVSIFMAHLESGRPESSVDSPPAFLGYL